METAETAKFVDAEEARRGLNGQFILAYLLAAGLLAALVYRAGALNILAVSRLLGLANRAGIIPFTDKDTTLSSSSIPLEFHYQTADPLDWGILGLAGALFLVVLLLKSVQFHSLARFAWINGSFGQHARAYLYGTTVNRFFPFNLGNVATASALEGQGAAFERGALVVFIGDVFVAVEVAVFTLVAWRTLGVTKWMAAMVWPFGILLVAYVFLHPVRSRAASAGGVGAFAAGKKSLRSLAQRPVLFGWMTLISIAAFALEVFASYFVVQALASTRTLLGITFGHVIVGVLAWHVARRVAVTPGGLGQGEWGFTLAMYAAGAGFAASATTVLVVTLVRYAVAGLVFGGLVLGKGAETNLGRTLQIFAGDADPLSPRTEPART